MELYCTRPGCLRPVNQCSDLDDPNVLKAIQQKFCTNCGMPLILVGRYLPTRLLGQGGFGTAYLGRDRYTPKLRPCVVKQFQPAGNLKPAQLKTAQDLFEREAEELERLGREHPQIPDLFAFFELTVPNARSGKDDKFFYLVQEYIDGQTLEEELMQNGVFSEADVLEVLKQTLQILQFVHENGSIHRDIKPSNIMRHRNGRLYLLDFGAVKQVAKTAGTQSSTGIYSIGYAPPEQMAGGQIYPSSDLYALAVTCILLLTGKQPNELFNSYSNSWKWKPFAQTSPTLAAVLDRMLLPTPSDRFESATDVLNVLTPPAPQPIIVSPPPVSSSQAPPAARSPRFQLPTFSTIELMISAVFTGFEGGLLAIALVSLLGTTWISAGFWMLLLGTLILAQLLRVIERVDLLILAVVSLGIVAFFRQFNEWALRLLALDNSFLHILMLAGLTGLLALAIAILFRLIYTLVSRIL